MLYLKGNWHQNSPPSFFCPSTFLSDLRHLNEQINMFEYIVHKQIPINIFWSLTKDVLKHFHPGQIMWYNLKVTTSPSLSPAATKIY